MVKEHYNDQTLCLLEPSIIKELKGIFVEFKPEIIIELGTYYGGFTKYLTEWFSNIPIYTIDIVDRLSILDTKIFCDRGNVIQIITDIFKNNEFLINLLSCKKKKIFFCDDGNKKKEINLFAKFLLPGDLLGVHDVGTEVFYEDIKDTLSEFEDHIINEEFSKAGVSEARLYFKKL
jgi:cephalosporin hydroxylase